MDRKIHSRKKRQDPNTDPCAPIAGSVGDVHDPYCCDFPGCCGDRPEDRCFDLEEEFEFDFDDNFDDNIDDNFDDGFNGFDDFGVGLLE